MYWHHISNPSQFLFKFSQTRITFPVHVVGMRYLWISMQRKFQLLYGWKTHDKRMLWSINIKKEKDISRRVPGIEIRSGLPIIERSH